MKKSLGLLITLCLCAASAHAKGYDLTAVACPGSAGATTDAGTLDCAGGSTLMLLATFQPYENISDFVAVDGLFDITVGDGHGDTGGPDNFWDFETYNSGALNGGPQRPSSGCSQYTNAFGVANSGYAMAAGVQGASRTQIATTSYRPSNLSVLTDQKIFACQLLFDLSYSVESGSGYLAAGCTSKVSFAIVSLFPGSASNNPVTTISVGSTPYSNVVVANGSGLPVPTTRHSWGQLKSMYR